LPLDAELADQHDGGGTDAPIGSTAAVETTSHAPGAQTLPDWIPSNWQGYESGKSPKDEFEGFIRDEKAVWVCYRVVETGKYYKVNTALVKDDFSNLKDPLCRQYRTKSYNKTVRLPGIVDPRVKGDAPPPSGSSSTEAMDVQTAPSGSNQADSSSSGSSGLTSQQAKRQRTDDVPASMPLVLYIPKGNLTQSHCTELVAIDSDGGKQTEFLDFMSQMPPAKIDKLIVQMRQATDPQEAWKVVKACKASYHKEIHKNVSEDEQKYMAEWRQANRDVDATALRLQNSKIAELSDEISKANAQQKELRKRGFAHAGPHELCSRLKAAIDGANDRVEEAAVQGCIPDARNWAQRLESAPGSVEWNVDTLDTLSNQDLRDAFHCIGKAHLLPKLLNPEPVKVWNYPNPYKVGTLYAHEICCSFETVSGRQDIWGMPTALSSYFSLMGHEAKAKFAEIKQRAEAGEFPVDTDPTRPTERTAKALPPLNPQPAGETNFDEYMRYMQATTNAPPGAMYNAAAKESQNAKLDPGGEMKLHTLINKFNAFCNDHDLDRMSYEDFDSDFFSARGLRLVRKRDADEVIQGVAPAPIHV